MDPRPPLQDSRSRGATVVSGLHVGGPAAWHGVAWHGKVSHGVLHAAAVFPNMRLSLMALRFDQHACIVFGTWQWSARLECR
jgi:hypothetical protein